MKSEIVFTSHFEAEFKRLSKKYHSLKNDFSILIKELEKNPTKGIPLGINCYKIRMAVTSKGKGKSGGVRIITHLYLSKEKLYLLSIYDKSAKENISDKERESLLKLIQ